MPEDLQFLLLLESCLGDGITVLHYEQAVLAMGQVQGYCVCCCTHSFVLLVRLQSTIEVSTMSTKPRKGTPLLVLSCVR